MTLLAGKRAGGSFELHLRHRRQKLCICGHIGAAHNILSCKLCSCEYFRLSACQPGKSANIGSKEHDKR